MRSGTSQSLPTVGANVTLHAQDAITLRLPECPASRRCPSAAPADNAKVNNDWAPLAPRSSEAEERRRKCVLRYDLEMEFRNVGWSDPALLYDEEKDLSRFTDARRALIATRPERYRFKIPCPSILAPTTNAPRTPRCRSLMCHRTPGRCPIAPLHQPHQSPPSVCSPCGPRCA